MGLIVQTAQFTGVTPEALYAAYLSAKDHSAMTADGSQRTVFSRPSEGEVVHGQEGDELRAFGLAGPDGAVQFSLTATIVRLVPARLIVMAWKNKVWNMALDPNDITDLDSTVVLTFRTNMAGAEIQLVQANVPDYKVSIPETGEVGPLSVIVNTHWSLLYWEPMRRYFQGGAR
jgi:hypothetical protein